MNHFPTWSVVKRILSLVFLVLLFACSKDPSSANFVGSRNAPMQSQAEGQQAPQAGRFRQAQDVKLVEEAAPAPQNATKETRRYKAVSYFLTLQSEPDKLPALWKEAQDYCSIKLADKCEVITSSIMRPDQNLPPTASLQIRILPEQVTSYLSKARAGSETIEDRTQSEDKTDAVIDTEARLKNLGAMRDRLRELLNTPNAKLKDLIEVEREIVRVQSELDSLNGMRKALANETDKVAIHLTFVSRRSIAESSALSPINEAVLSMGRLFASSIAAIITFFAVVLPWLVLLLVLTLIIKKIMQRLRRPAAASNSKD